MKKIKVNNNILLIIIFIVLMLLIISFLVIYNNLKSIKEEDEALAEYNEVQKELNEQYIADKQIVPEGFNFVVRLYEGELPSDDFYSAIYKLVYEEINEINVNLKNKSNKTIQNYYEINKDRIYQNLGIDNFNEYNKIVKRVCEIDASTYKSSYFDLSNFVTDEDGYAKVDLGITFENSNINFIMYIVNEVQENKPSIIFILN